MAITAAIVTFGAIISFWAANLVQEKLPSENSTAEMCHAALFTFYSGSYDAPSKKLNIVVENKRSIDLKLEKIYLIYEGNVKSYDINQTLEGNMLKSVIVKEVDDGFTSVEIKTNCPDVTTSFKRSDLT